jgi:hypothetical protein
MNCRSCFRTVWETVTGAVLLVVAHSVSAATTIERTPVTGKIQWIYGYEEGQKLARETGKPMFVVFRCER